MTQTIILPTCLNIKYEGNPEDIVDSLMGEAFDAGQSELMDKLDETEGLEEQLAQAYPGEKIDPEDWLSYQIGMMLYAYVTHRTGMLFNEEEDLLNGTIEDVSEILGDKATQDLLAIISRHADKAISSRYKNQLQ